MSIFILEQHSERVPFGDVPSHPALLGTCFTFISFSIVAFVLGSLETCLPTRGYVGTYYFINNKHYGYESIAQNLCHWSPFSRSHTVSITVGHKHYRVFLPSNFRLSWLLVIHKPTLHRSPFSRLHTVNITIGHKHYRVSLYSDLRSSWLWVIDKSTLHRSPFASLHIVSIIVGHKHYRLSLSSDLHSS